ATGAPPSSPTLTQASATAVTIAAARPQVRKRTIDSGVGDAPAGRPSTYTTPRIPPQGPVAAGKRGGYIANVPRYSPIIRIASMSPRGSSHQSRRGDIHSE